LLIVSIEFVKKMLDMKWNVFAETYYLLAIYGLTSEALIFMGIKKIKTEINKFE